VNEPTELDEILSPQIGDAPVAPLSEAIAQRLGLTAVNELLIELDRDWKQQHGTDGPS
jgi:hypothetical protein